MIPCIADSSKPIKESSSVICSFGSASSDKEPSRDRDRPHKLLTWFDQNRRDLPWREGRPRNPYYVWVSEIMLQQTRTEAVKPYFESWKRRFPTIEALAEAEDACV